jgi:hypothetical protein
MTRDTDLPHQQPDSLQKPPRSFKSLKPLALIAAVLLIALVSGTGGYLLGIRSNQNMSQNTASQNPVSSTQEPSQAAFSTNMPTVIMTESPISQIQQPSISPDTVLQIYYNWYLACQKYHFANANVGTVNKSPKEDCPYNKTGLLTSALANTLQQAIAFDPVLCTQNTPSGVTYDKAVVTNTHATAMVHTVWGASPKQNISVGLDIQNGAWKISSITCPQF